MAQQQTSKVVIGRDTKYCIMLRVEATGGKGFGCFLYGGDKPCVGGVAAISRKDGERTIKFGDRNDDEIALEVGRIIYDSFGEPVVVTAGVQLTDATDEDMRQLKSNWIAAAKHFCATYDRR